MIPARCSTIGDKPFSFSLKGLEGIVKELAQGLARQCLVYVAVENGLPVVHEHRALHRSGEHREIVGDKKQGQGLPLMNFVYEVQHFSPDGKWVVLTSQRAGYSAEEISLPFQFQPYGDLFAVRLDGTGLLRLTHNGFEEGTPAWGPAVDFRPSTEADTEESSY